MHLFSMTCKVDAVLDLFTSAVGRRRAVQWFAEHRIGRIYLESYRHRRFADAAILAEQRDFFRAVGLDVGACITTTQMSRRTASWPITTCFTDPSAHAFLQEVVERTAGLFDRIILDDFFFCTCTCEHCERERQASGLPWNEFRRALMLDVARRWVLAPARAINPQVRLIIKYPCWYESYRNAGYDVLSESELFDLTWIGTETREPDSPEAGRRPQTAASWIQGWANEVGGGKCGGAWYDPIDTTPPTFVEQARQSIIGGAGESLLHCYDYLATTTPGLAIHGKDLEVRNGRADAAAFRREADGLQRMAEILSGMRPFGVLVPKQPEQDGRNEAYLPGFVGLLGIPVVAASTLRSAPAAFLGAQAGGFPDAVTFAEEAVRRRMPLVVTTGFLSALDGQATLRLLGGASPPIAAGPWFVDDALTVLRCPADLWDLTRLDPAVLARLRQHLLRPFGISFTAPARVSLHLFATDDGGCEVVENFNDEPVEVGLAWHGVAVPRSLELALPDPDAVRLTTVANGCRLVLSPRSLALLYWRHGTGR